MLTEIEIFAHLEMRFTICQASASSGEENAIRHTESHLKQDWFIAMSFQWIWSLLLVAWKWRLVSTPCASLAAVAAFLQKLQGLPDLVRHWTKFDGNFVFCIANVSIGMCESGCRTCQPLVPNVRASPERLVRFSFLSKLCFKVMQLQ